MPEGAQIVQHLQLHADAVVVKELEQAAYADETVAQLVALQNRGAQRVGQLGAEVAEVQLVRAGAHDYLMKDNLVRLGPTIEREMQEAENRRARRWAEEQLRGSQLYTRLLMESNIDALMTTDPLGIITDVNRQMEILAGHSRDPDQPV